MSHACEESSNCCWMKKLGDSGFGSRCLLRSILPGSHDSATCNISKSKPYASNAPPILLKAKRIYSGKRLKDLVVRWAIAQNRSIYEQLCDGIRYIDLRICSVKHPGDKIGSMYTCHSVISDKIEDIIEQVKTYTEQHPTEIIILDFNHFYDMDEPTHRHLAELLEEKLGSLMIPNTTPIDINIGSLWESGKSIYVFYEQNCKGLESYSFLWSQVHLYSAWMNTPDVSVLKNKLMKHLSFRKKVIDGEVDCKKRNYKKIFHVAQGIVTPDGKMIASGLLRGKFNSLEDLGNCVTPKFISWFSEEWKSLDLNILLADHYYNSNFVDVIIQMNRALLEG